jgi:hypothetical protein|tara:strand:- start:9737 stop:11137 length:1401 start_codon:yes stop_codon:yes gene_type:complete
MKIDYFNKLKNNKPTIINKSIIHDIAPNGVQADLNPIHVPEQIIPSLNSEINFQALSSLSMKNQPGLSDLQNSNLPINFNWIDDGGDKSKYISNSGNQMLCGSCWAISTAGIVADNHVVAGTVDYKPNLSTTWSLSCYPQLQCKGGNPSILLDSVNQKGLASNSCVDYSWCALNDICNGKATKHFKEAEKINLSQFIPNCGCIDSNVDHLLYFIEKPEKFSLMDGDSNYEHFRLLVKRHIKTYGPVLGGFLVFKNFMSGAFTKVNGGIYLENAVYNNGKVRFEDNYANATNFSGSHAISIIGWGEKEIIIDNKGTKKVVPYWECKNSWTEKWGNKGRFRMAMYPFNKMSQFDKITSISANGKNIKVGGMILIKASGKPKQTKLPQINDINKMKTLKAASFYASEHKDYDGNSDNTSGKKNILNIFLKTFSIFLIVVFSILFLIFIYKMIRKFSSRRKLSVLSRIYS